MRMSQFTEVLHNPLTNFLPAGWSAVPEEKGSRYRLSIKDVQPQDSGTYTCASPRGLTNSIIIVVAGNSYLNEPSTFDDDWSTISFSLSDSFSVPDVDWAKRSFVVATWRHQAGPEGNLPLSNGIHSSRHGQRNMLGFRWVSLWWFFLVWKHWWLYWRKLKLTRKFRQFQ